MKVNRREFIVGAVTGASTTGVLCLAGGTIAGRRPAPRPTQAAAPNTPHQGRRSFSQQGEDLVLFNLLHDELRLKAPTYLDIGAGDPILSNNTYLLYCAGSRGVLVEPNPTMVERLRSVRPNDVVVQAGVGVTEAAEADYYVIRGQWALNTFSAEMVAKLRRQLCEDPVEKVMKIPLMSINRLIADHFKQAPDLVSIDIEGLDLAVLRTLDFKRFRPATICAEAKGPSAGHDDTPIARLLKSNGYVACAGSLYNTIFADRSRLG